MATKPLSEVLQNTNLNEIDDPKEVDKVLKPVRPEDRADAEHIKAELKRNGEIDPSMVGLTATGTPATAPDTHGAQPHGDPTDTPLGTVGSGVVGGHDNTGTAG